MCYLIFAIGMAFAKRKVLWTSWSVLETIEQKNGGLCVIPVVVRWPTVSVRLTKSLSRSIYCPSIYRHRSGAVRIRGALRQRRYMMCIEQSKAMSHTDFTRLKNCNLAIGSASGERRYSLFSFAGERCRPVMPWAGIWDGRRRFRENRPALARCSVFCWPSKPVRL